MDKKLTNKRKKRVTKDSDLVIGILWKHRKGFGFVIPEDETLEDIFIGPNNMNHAMNGDQVCVKILQPSESNRAREGIIHVILQRNTLEIIGTFEHNRNFGFVVSDDKKINDDIFVSKANFNGAKMGDKVVLVITKWPEHGHKAEGRISEIISKKGEAGGDIKALIRQYNLSKIFPQKAQLEAETVENMVTADQIEKRRDIREKNTITIDGATSKDFDDAVSLERLENGHYLLGVHIADVSHYVGEGGALDREALKRGNSVYLIDQVVPMLPERLSNGICSLNPNEDRLTLSIDMEVNGEGVVVAHEIYESVMNSKARMIYTEVSDILENEDKGLIEKYRDIYQDLKNMDELAKILRGVREQRGSLDFDFDEAFITLNKKGIPISIEAAERRVANKIIEEFMLLANETVAEHFFWMEVPFVYRVHEKPDAEKIEEFKKFIGGFGLSMKGNADNIHPKTLNEVIQMVQGKPEENIINTVMLRSMKKAFYDPTC
ncbi:MAG: VacB/RNase II family 3'-5' exoribonuclease, partial [Anaerovorax sp.]